MRKFIIILIMSMLGQVMAQNLVLPKEAKEDLKKVKIGNSNTRTPTATKNTKSTNSDNSDTEKASLPDGVIDNFYPVRIEYVLQYKNDGEMFTLAKDENNYFGFNVVAAVAADGMIWLNASQLKPWLRDEEYKLYKNDTLYPAVSKVMVKYNEVDDFVEVQKTGGNIELLNDDISAYVLQENVKGFKINYKREGKDPLAVFFTTVDNSTADAFYVFTSNTTADYKDLEKFLASNDDDFDYGVLLFAPEGKDEYELSELLTVNDGNIFAEKVSYKKSLKVISKKGSKKCHYCCDDIEAAKDKKAYKKIIDEWEDLLKEAKEGVKNGKGSVKSEELFRQMRECEVKLDQYKKGFLGIKF